MNAWWDWMLNSSLLINWMLSSCCLKMVVNFDFNLSETYSATTITGATNMLTNRILLQGNNNTIRES